jgi:hypothetical protein
MANKNTPPTPPTDEMTRAGMLGITLASIGLVYLLWNIDFLSFLAYPFRLFVTYVHESGHALAALASGGQVVGFAVSADGSGVARTIGGSRALILPAGYIGAALFGAILFYLVHHYPRYVRLISRVLGVGLIVFTLLYARPISQTLPIALIVGLSFGVLLLVIAQRASMAFNLILLSVLAIMTGLNAVMDITTLVRYADTCQRGLCNDAYAFSHEVAPILPATAWAFIWAGISIILIGVSVYYSLVRVWGNDKQRLNSSTIDEPVARSTPIKSTTTLDNLKRDKDGDIDWTQF